MKKDAFAKDHDLANRSFDEAVVLMLARMIFPVTVVWFVLEVTVRYVSDGVIVALVLAALVGSILGDWSRLYPSFKPIIMKHFKTRS